MNKVKLLVSDYDQTFYLNDDDVNKNIISLERFINANNIFVIATGRAYASFKEVANKYNIKYSYLILEHGATILDSNDNIIFTSYIQNDISKAILEDNSLKDGRIQTICTSNSKQVENTFKELTRIHFRYPSEDKAMHIKKIIDGKYAKFVNSYYVSYNCIEIISKNTSKADGISLIAKKIGVDNSDIYTIGDGYSDIDMIKRFNGYAIKGAVKELLQVSNGSYDSVSNYINDILESKI